MKAGKIGFRKKTMALLLSSAMVFSTMSVPVFAEESGDVAEEAVIQVFDEGIFEDDFGTEAAVVDPDMYAEYVQAEAAEYSLTVDNQVGGDPTISVDEVVAGEKIAEGTHSFLIQGDYITDELMEAYVTLTVNGVQVEEQTEIGYDNAAFDDVMVNGDVVIKIAPYEEQADTKTYKVAVSNGAESANTEYAVNGLHVWRTDGDDDSDILGTVDVEEGTKLNIYPYPVASDIWFTVIHDGETLYDGLVKKIIPYEEDDKLPDIDIVLKGDLEVTTRVAYTVTIDDQVKSNDVVFTVGTVDLSGDAPKAVELKSGDTLYEGDYLSARVINTSANLLKLSALRDDGNVLDEVLIGPGAGTEDGTANGIMIPAMESNVKFVLEKATASLKDTAKLTLSKTSVTFTGKAIKPGTTVKATIGEDVLTLKKGTDYTVSYKNNIKTGTATVTVTGKGNYTGTLSAKFKITAPKVTASKLSSVTGASKKFTAKWKKVSGVTGYQIQYSTKKNFKSGNKTVTVKGAKNVSKVISKLKKGTYYVRIRSYKTVSGTTFRSSWSAAKTVKVK